MPTAQPRSTRTRATTATTAFSTTEISQSKGKLTIKPRKGSFDGMPAERSYTLKIHDGKGGIRTIAVPPTPCNQELTVEI